MEINKYKILIEYIKRHTGTALSLAHIEEIEAMLAEPDGKVYPKKAKVRCIIFLESKKFKQYEGQVFNRFEDAQNYLLEEMNEGFFEVARVGVFVDHPDYDPPQRGIMDVDIVKKKESKKALQLKMFK